MVYFPLHLSDSQEKSHWYPVDRRLIACVHYFVRLIILSVWHLLSAVLKIAASPGLLCNGMLPYTSFYICSLQWLGRCVISCADCTQSCNWSEFAVITQWGDMHCRQHKHWLYVNLNVTFCWINYLINNHI